MRPAPRHLGAVTTTAVANLLEALGREELRNVCVVIADLAANYQAGSAQINAALQEAVRFALTENPVVARGERGGEIFRLVANQGPAANGSGA